MCFPFLLLNVRQISAAGSLTSLWVSLCLRPINTEIFALAFDGIQCIIPNFYQSGNFISFVNAGLLPKQLLVVGFLFYCNEAIWNIIKTTRKPKPDVYEQFFLTQLQILRTWVLWCRLTYLFVWINVDVAFDTFLSHVSPGVATHPLPLTLRALVLSKASLLPLVGCQSFTFGSGL